MISHHFIGAGSTTGGLTDRARQPEDLLAAVEELIRDAHLRVVSSHSASFPGGGLTLVWVLAESHLVLHLWPEERAATIDLHVCDFRSDNEGKARAAVARLTDFCFAPGSAEWREMSVTHQIAEPAPAVAMGAKALDQPDIDS
jgi:S-adenosylmethionine/arginine decarboxylase-like enzyme